jgi:hypothetical protein
LGSALAAFALLRSIAVAVHLQDVDMMRKPVEQRAGEPFGAGDVMMPPFSIG